MTRVLLVMGDEGMASQLGQYLESSGLEVTSCPGPQAPAYVCMGGRGVVCPLTSAADVVVLDGWLRSDAVRAGTPSWHMLLYYRRSGLPVVFLVGPDGAPVADNDVHPLPRGVEFEQIAEAIVDLSVTKVGAPRLEE